MSFDAPVLSNLGELQHGAAAQLYKFNLQCI